ncbi:MAG: right-handed parallel beta-helix repeat-containing protein [Thermoguttaceae bacterium]|nr:right-handed parallel beta-helix repeat-containing protein [Thermoguttaceae bacterium]
MNAFDSQSTFLPQDDFQSDGYAKPLEPGRKIGKFQNFTLVRSLGRGGMGQAWLAEEDLGRGRKRTVVCKLLPMPVQDDKKSMDGIAKTFDLTSRLFHPNICPLFGMNEDPDYGLFFVMDYCEGGSLWDWFQKPENLNGIALSELLPVFRPIAEALDHAHGMHIIHRDVKPQNIVFALRDGKRIPCLIDFGLAARISAAMAMSMPTAQACAGTPQYMPPEQLMGEKEQDGRVDQYSLAASIYHLLAGRPPFEGNLYSLAVQVMQKVPEPIPTLSASENAAILKALSKAPADRFPTCSDFLDALAGNGAGSDSCAGSVSQPDLPSPHEISSAVFQSVSPTFPQNVSQPVSQAFQQSDPQLGFRSFFSSGQYCDPVQTVTWPADGLTLQQAYDKTPSGGTLLILHGVHQVQQTLVVRKDIKIIGETGDRDSVVLQGGRGNVLRLESGFSEIRNLTFRNVGVDDFFSGSAVLVMASMSKFHSCRFVSHTGIGFAALQNQADPIVVHCTAKKCGNAGFFVGQGAKGKFTQCEALENACAGFQVQGKGTEPTVENCRFQDNQHCGLLVQDGAGGIFEHCTFRRNGRAGIRIREKGTEPTVNDCTIQDNFQYGISIDSKAGGTFRGNHLFGHKNLFGQRDWCIDIAWLYVLLFVLPIPSFAVLGMAGGAVVALLCCISAAIYQKRNPRCIIRINNSPNF